MTENEATLNPTKRITYSSIIYGVEGHDILSAEERVGFKAIDLMIGALVEDEAFERGFMESQGLTLGDRSRLHKTSNQNYAKDVLWGVHNPEEFFWAVLINSNEMLYQDKHVQDWGRRLLALSTNGNGVDDVELSKAKKMIRNLVESQSDHFSLEIHKVLE